MNNNISNTPNVPQISASSGINTPSIIDLFIGDDKYISGLLIALANLVGFISHFKKAKYNKYTTYITLFVLIVLATVLSSF